MKSSKRYLTIDVETTGLRKYAGDKITVVGVERDGEVAYFTSSIYLREALIHSEDINSLGVATIEDGLSNFLYKHKDYEIICYNGMFDYAFLKPYLPQGKIINHDVMFLMYLLSTTEQLNKGKTTGYLTLKKTAQRVLGVDDWDITLTEKSKITKAALEYLALDLKYTKQLFDTLYSQLDTRQRITYWIMCNASMVFSDIEQNGIGINVAKMDETERELKEELDILKKEFDADCPGVNIRSSKQLRQLLYKELKLPVPSYTEKGAPSTAVDALKEIEHLDPIVAKILEYRNLDKALTFLNDWREREINGRLHPSFHLTSTITGRTSSSKPNIQNVPRNKKLRALFDGGSKDKMLIQLDYSQMELRIVAIVADIQNMKEAYRDGKDIHTEMALEIIKQEGREVVTKSDRTLAKPVNFGFLYGLAAKSFPPYAKTTFNIDVSLEQAIDLRNTFFKKYPELPVWYQNVEHELMEKGYVDTLFGRKYMVGYEELVNPFIRSKHVRKTINAKVQTAASDYALLGLIEVNKYIRNVPGLKLVGTVHDSILLEWNMTILDDRGRLQSALRVIKNTLEKPRYVDKILPLLGNITIDIPIVIDIEAGPWGSGKEVKV